MELVPPSLLRSSNVPSSFWSVFQCLSWQSICVHLLYVLQPLFLVLFYFLYYVLCSRFFPNTSILFFIQFCYSSKISSVLLLNVSPLFSSVPKLHFQISIIIKYYNITISWGHRRICGSSLTETSLCCAYLYFQHVL